MDNGTNTPLALKRITYNIVFDPNTSLEWQDIFNVKKRNWHESKNYCSTLVFANHYDWKLPSAIELESIVSYKKDSSDYHNKAFRNYSSEDYWSSSIYSVNSDYAYYVYFGRGNSFFDKKTVQKYVRCVRVSQYSDTLSFNKTVEKFIKQELDTLPKPPNELKLVKDQFETTKEFNARVKKARRDQKKIAIKYKKDVIKLKVTAQKRAIKKALQQTWGKPLLSGLQYDADNGYFIANLKFEAKKEFNKKVAIKVDRKNAKKFYANKNNLKPQAIFDYNGKSVKLKDIRVPFKKKTYLAQFTDMSIDDTRVAVNLSNDLHVDTNVNTNVSVGSSTVSSFDASKLKDYRILDRLLAKTSQVSTDNKKWLFVVGIEQYEFTDNISYSSRSAKMFKKVMKKKLGVPEKNCYTMIDNGATQAKIKTNLKKMLRRVKGGDTIYFYYNGHGIPVPSQKNEPYMLTSDSEPDFVADESFFALKNIYGKLSSSKAKKVVAVVDSCFSGVTDGKAVLKGVAATKMKSKSVKFDKEKMVVLSAGKGHQFSNGYDKKGYRLFSFYIMENILNGDTTIKQLYKDTKKETYETSLEEYGDLRVQEPTVEGNFRLSL